MRKMTIALVVAGLMGFAGCSKKQTAATTPENAGSGSDTGGSGYGGSTEPTGAETPAPDEANPCGGSEANPCG